jgi:cation:H+ antiporter
VEPLTIVMTLAGFGLLVIGAEWLVRGASRLASMAGISSLVIGLTVVAFGTSAPEVAVTVQSAIDGQPDLGVGNVIGSNIFNVLFILGVSALIVPLVVSRQLVRWDVPVMIATSVAALVLSLDGAISAMDGAILVVALGAYVIWSIRLGRREVRAEGGDATVVDRSIRSIAISAGLIGVGLAVLVLGANWLVDGATAIARTLGVSELVIGLTIVAAGTSLPEVATSIIASIRGQRDIAVGNVVGSNIFNVLGVLGFSSILAPTGGIPIASSVLTFDFPVMIAVAVACLPVFFHQGKIDRWEGAVFVVYYILYTVYLILDAAGHDALPMYSDIMMEFVIPITVLTLAVVVLRYIRSDRTAVKAA